MEPETLISSQATQTTVQMACDSAEHLDTWLEAGSVCRTGVER